MLSLISRKKKVFLWKELNICMNYVRLYHDVGLAIMNLPSVLFMLSLNLQNIHHCFR